jgi:aldehyde dehydrogenase (NAD+)
MRPERVATPLVAQVATSRILREPLGVVLIIGSWNYPIQLVLIPLVAAIAAGNCAVLKPSEVASASSAVLADNISNYLDRDAFVVVEGGKAETSELLEQRFDRIFYTGGGGVGRIVMTAAAKHLTPVTLELGGKNPCVVARDADISMAARRIAWGKFLNAGQTCIAPDYVLVHESREAELLDALGQRVRDFYGRDPARSADYGRIINDRHVERLKDLLACGEPAVGGEVDAASRYIAPTVLTKVDLDSRIMNEEIFGPILPVVPVADWGDAIAFINKKPRSLAAYIFTRDRVRQQRMLEETSSGSVGINDLLLDFAVHGLPFGGVGESGIGAYHGRHGFETFSHRKSVYKRHFAGFDLPIRYPPFTSTKFKLLRWLLSS